MSTDTFKADDWVRITRFPSSYVDYRSDAHVGKIIYISDERADVRLYTATGAVLVTLTVGLRSLKKADDPKFRTALSDVPNTPEVQALKDVVYVTAMRYKRTHGLCNVLDRSLEELGIEKPATPKVRIKVQFDVEVNIDQIVPNALTEEDFNKTFDGFGRADQVRATLGRLDYSTAKLDYKLLPVVRPPAVTVDKEGAK